MIPSSLVGVMLAVASALVWGSGDFAGGLAARKLSPYQVTAAAALSGLLSLGLFMLLRGEVWPDSMGALWSAAAGLAGAVGIACLYRALSGGNQAIAASVSGVVGAAIPVLFDAVVEGLPPPLKLAGFGLGIVAIALVSQSAPSSTGSRWLAVLLGAAAGTGFGMFFVLISNVKGALVFSPLVIARGSMLLASTLLMLSKRQTFPNVVQHPVSILAGVLDAGGNMLFLLARQFTRLDVASVLSSLYPASTILLARLILHEPMRNIQLIGIVLCLMAIGLIVA